MSCSPKLYPLPNTKTVETIRTQRITDTIVEKVIDSAMLSMLLECDSLGRVKIKAMQSKMSAYMVSNLTLQDNLLTLESVIKSLKMQRKEVITDTVREKIEIPVPYPVVEKQKHIPWWARWLSCLGGLYLLRTIIKLALNWHSITFKQLLKLL